MLLQTSCVIRQLFYLCFAKKLHLVPILFILESKGMFNAVEFHKTTQNSCITLNSLLRSLITLGNLLELFHVPQHLHIHVCVLSLVLGQEVFKVLVHCMQESVYLFKRRLGQVFNGGHTLVYHICELLAFVLRLLRGQIQLVQQYFAHFDQLLMRHLEILV